MENVKRGLALENCGEMSLVGAMIAIMLTADYPRRPGKKHDKIRNVRYKEVARNDRRTLSWMRRARNRFSHEL